MFKITKFIVYNLETENFTTRIKTDAGSIPHFFDTIEEAIAYGDSHLKAYVIWHYEPDGRLFCKKETMKEL